MNTEELKENLGRLKSLIKEIDLVQGGMSEVKNEEKAMLLNFIEGAKGEMRKISSSIPGFFEEKRRVGRVELTSSEKRKYLADLGLTKDTLKITRKKIEKRKLMELETAKTEKYHKPGVFTKLSGKIFTPISLKLSKSEFFQSIGGSLRKANMPYLISTYLAIAFLAAFISLFMAIIAAVALSQTIGYSAILIVVFVPLVTFFVVLIYPMSEISSIKNKIDDELPFVTMHMSAISSSGVEPSRVFSILAASPEYPSIRKEMRKIVNMINFYGYDLTSALKATAKTTSSERLAELLNGMSATISGGGDLRNYLDKIAADSLLDYKLRRKRFTTVSETYADIYTGLLIAAPLMFMLILVLMNVVTGNIAGLSSTTIAAVGIGAIIALNIGFLVFLEISQPSA